MRPLALFFKIKENDRDDASIFRGFLFVFVQTNLLVQSMLLKLLKRGGAKAYTGIDCLP